MDSEIGRFPRLFRGKESIPGLTWPDLVFHKRVTLWLGSREVQIIHIGRSHTAGDTVVWLPKEKVLFAGDAVEFGATPYCGDAHFTDWPSTLQAIRALGAERLVPGRGRSLIGRTEVDEAIRGTEAFTSDLFAIAKAGVAKGATLKQVYDEAMAAMRPKYGHWVIFEHCMPFDVSRAYDEAQGLDHPRIWTAERDLEMWQTLERGTDMKSAEVHS
jgi:glyoxylase-like metal-dependent hydrolase (beta-lactamase superfamily II)